MSRHRNRNRTSAFPSGDNAIPDCDPDTDPDTAMEEVVV